MANPLPKRQLYTGSTTFIKANPYLMESMWMCASVCTIHTVEDIFDRRGMKLWASNRPVTPQLMEKLCNRELRKPIELCVLADDPVKEAAIEEILKRLCAGSPALNSVVGQHWDAITGVLLGMQLTPQELLLVSLLRHGKRDYLTHSVAVTAIALAVGVALGMTRDELMPLAHAGLLHDVGRLYFAAEPSMLEQHEIHGQHPHVSALAAVELGQMTEAVGQIIWCSHERLNGSGFPRRLQEDKLLPHARMLLFAEATCTALLNSELGLVRAAVVARLVAHEFDSRMAEWIGSIARTEQGLDRALPMPLPAETIGRRLRRLHAQLSRILVLFSLTIGESTTARESADRWLRDTIHPLLHALRSCGVEDALAMGLQLEPGSPTEAAELEAIQAEILHRLKYFARCVNWQRVQDDMLASSTMVSNLLRILHGIDRHSQ